MALTVLQSIQFVLAVFQMQEEQGAGSTGDSSQPPPFVPSNKPVRKERPSAFTPTEDTYRDTANLVKEDSDV